MKINGRKPPQGAQPGRSAPTVKGAGGSEKTEKAAPVAPATPADKVQISDGATSAADMLAVIDKLPEIREQKVQDVKQAVDSGTYEINPEKVAEKMLKEM